MIYKSANEMPEVNRQSRIPHLLHQIYLGGPLPEPLANNVERLKRNNPMWQHCLYDDHAATRFIREQYGSSILKLYLSINPGYAAARSDLFRYLVLYIRGGVYLDVKSQFQRPIDEVILGNESYVLSRWRNAPGEIHEGWGLHTNLYQAAGGEFQQWHIISVPGHPFLRAVIERVVAGIRNYSAASIGTGWIGVLRLTGPIAYTQAIMPIIDQHPCRLLANEQEVGLEYSAFPNSSHQAFSREHYTQRSDVVVLNKGVRRWWDKIFLALRSFKRRLTDTEDA